MPKILGYLLIILLMATWLAPIPAVGSNLDAVVRLNASIPPQARTAGSLGTEREGNGIVIDREGHILTIGYLILEASRIEVTTGGGRKVPAQYVGYDHATGFGILRTVPPLDVTPIALGDSAAVAVGDPMRIITAGEAVQGPARVMSRDAFVGYWEYLLENSIYVAPAHPDYGGAALLADDGRLVGVGSILTRFHIESMGWVPCNMFVPIDLLKPILNELITQGETQGPPQPWMGLHSDDVQGRVFVLRVSERGPSAAAGLNPGDIILSVKDQPVSDTADFYRKVWALGQAGTAIPLRVLQGDQVKNIVIHSMDRRQYLLPASKKIGHPI
ncbi:MAG: S1C family serine protease [Desulfobacterales bacterium]|jgi:S1-C subfamily serine protease